MERRDRVRLLALAAAVGLLIIGVVATRTSAPGAPVPSDAAPVVLVPPADPLPWRSVSWRQLALPPGAAGLAGHARIDGLVHGPLGLVGWGRTATPGRNQFNDMGAAYLSGTGDAWAAIPIDAGVGPRDTSEIRLIAAGPAGLLAVGGVCCDDEERSASWTSGDGTTWTRVPLDPDLVAVDIVDVVATDDRWVGAGTVNGVAVIVHSGDGIAWETVDPGAAGLGPGGVSDLAVTRDGLVAVGWSDDGASYNGAIWRSADGRSWEKVDEPLLAGDQDTVLWRAVPFAGGEHLAGNEGPHAERVRCEQLLGLQASIAGQGVEIDGVADLSCGWGLQTEWLRLPGAPLQRLPVRWLGGVAPPAGTFIVSSPVAAGGPGLVAIGEAEGEAGLRLWTSRDGRTWEAALPGQAFRVGASVSGLVVDGRRLVVVGEDWDPGSNQPGVPAVWQGIAE